MSPSSTNHFICRTANVSCLRVTFNRLLDVGHEFSPRGIVCGENSTNFILVFVTTRSGHTYTYVHSFFGSLPKGVRLSEAVNNTCTPPTWTGEHTKLQRRGTRPGPSGHLGESESTTVQQRPSDLE